MNYPRIVTVLFVLWFSLPSTASDVPLKTISAEALDQGVVSLSGEWAFDWQELHIEHDRPVTETIVLPGLWHKQGPYDNVGFATFRITLTLPQIDRYYLRVPDAPSAIAIWVNGERIFSRGTVSHERTSEVPRFGPQVIQLPASDHYQLVMHISNHHHKDGGMWHNLKLANSANRSLLQDQSKLLDAMVFTFLLLVSSYLLLTAKEHLRRSASIFFACFVWVIALRSVFVGERIAYDIFGSLSWISLQRVEHILLLMALPLFAYYFHRFFKLKNLWFAHGMALVSGILCLVTLFSSAMVFTYFGLAAQVLGAVSVVYCVIHLLVLIKNKAPQSLLFLWGFLGWCVLVVHDFLYTHQVIQSRPLAQFGLLFFVVMQSYMLWLKRKSESRLLNYVKNVIDQKTLVLKEVFLTYEKQQAYIHQEILPVLEQSQDIFSEKEVEQTQLKSVIKDLHDLKPKATDFKLIETQSFAFGLKPYFHGLNCTLKTSDLEGYIHTNEDWLQHIVLLMARLGEIHGFKGEVKLSTKDNQFYVRYRIFSQDKYSLSDLPEFNLVERILLEFNSSLTFSIEEGYSQFFFSLALSGEHRQAEDSIGVVGNPQGMPILVSVDQNEVFVSALSNHYQVILNTMSVQNVKRYRPKLLVVQFNPNDHYQLDTLAEIKQLFPNLGVILVIDSYHKSQLVQFIKKGISDYVVQPVLEDELQLRVQTAMRYSELDNTVAETIDIREVSVQLIRTCIQLWQSYTGKGKADLAERSRLWRVYMDGSTAKTRTLDKYLSLQGLPKNPRWDTVARTASYVMDECPLSEKDRQDLEEQLKQFNQLLSV